MSTLEYQNDTVQIEIQSDGHINMMDSHFVEFIKKLYRFDELANLASVTLERTAPNQYLYRTTTANADELEYTIYRNGDAFTYSLTSNGTIWQPHLIVQNIDLRQSVFQLIVYYEVHTLEVTYP